MAFAISVLGFVVSAGVASEETRPDLCHVIWVELDPFIYWPTVALTLSVAYVSTWVCARNTPLFRAFIISVILVLGFSMAVMNSHTTKQIREFHHCEVHIVETQVVF